MPSIPSAFLIGCFGLLALTACTGQSPVPDVRLGHAILVERRPAELLLAPGPDGMVSVADTRRVKDFVDSWRDGGRGPLRVAIPERLGRGAQDRLLAQLAELVKRRDADASDILPIAAAQGAAGIISPLTISSPSGRPATLKTQACHRAARMSRPRPSAAPPSATSRRWWHIRPI
jgi:hypothetical protein